MQKPPRIVLVYDDEEIGIMMKMILEVKGFSVLVSKNADQIEETLRSDIVSLIILDMLIGGIKGTDICRELKNNESFAHLPLIIMTALPDAEILCRSAGADDFIAKPFEIANMMLKINHLLSNIQI